MIFLNDPDMSTMAVALTGTGVSTLTIAVNPSGSGTVTGTGISCPVDCTETYNTLGASIQLTAAPNTGYQFLNWSGDINSANNPETVPMDTNKAVTANFSINTYAFTAAGSYTGLSLTTDAGGNVLFKTDTFGQGSYKFRADYMGYQFWSGTVSLPGSGTLPVLIAEEKAEVTLVPPVSGVKIYLFSNTGT